MPTPLAPICVDCKHFDQGQKAGLTCAAFPDEIPERIVFSLFIHRKPFPGDHGIQFEPREE